MKILEVRDGFIKFEADENISLSSFVQVSGLEKNYIAQIIQIKRSGINSIAFAKILFLYDGTLRPYDKTLPSKDSVIEDFTFNIINNSINAKDPVITGVMPDKNINIIVDASSFNKKMLMSIDDKEENNILVRNLTKQFNNLNKNVVILDTLGVINAKKVIAGVDFKLPLDTASLAFLYQDCLNDATSDSKSLIIEIFKDLAEYSKTVPFVPFGALKDIIDEMVDKAHVFKLLVLKNKLAKFDKLGYFAKDKTDVDKIEKILSSKCSIIDFSKLDSAFQNRYLAFIYEKLKDSDNVQIFLELSNTVSKKNLKSILESGVSTAFITHSRFKYLNDIKNLFDNFIISPSLTNNEIFKVYSTFLKAIHKGKYLLAGDAVNYIPLISDFKLIDEVIPLSKSFEQGIQQEISSANEKFEESTQVIENKEDEQTISKTFEEELESDSENLTGNISNATESEQTNNEIIEPEIIECEDDEAEEIQNTIEEKTLSKDEILANIQEKSDNVILNAGKDLTPPDGSMFEEDAELDDVIENSNLPADDNYTDNSEDNQYIPDDSLLTEEEDDDDNDEDDDEIINNDSVQKDSDLSDEIFEELNLDNEYADSDNSKVATEPIENSVEEVPLEDSFEEEMNSLEEIQDYIPEENIVDTMELGSDVDLDSEENISQDDTVTDEYTETPVEEDSLEIDLPEDFDFEINSSDNDNIEDNEINTDNSTTIIEETSESSEEEFANLEEIIELDPEEADENDIVIDISNDNIEDTELGDDLDKQIVEDVDKVFTTRKDDDISDSDLDFIDELNSDDGILEELSDDSLLDTTAENEETEILENDSEQIDLEEKKEDDILETRSSSTPIVPVYDADIPQEDLVISDPIQQGDSVIHAKYGNGVVEKMIKYGNKTLFSINFDNIGRRLLDPTLTEIKKA